MNCNYIVIGTICFYESSAPIRYGIAAVEEQGAFPAILDAAFDLTSDFAKAKHLADLCNEQKLSASHLRDVAEDFVLSE